MIFTKHYFKALALSFCALASGQLYAQGVEISETTLTTIEGGLSLMYNVVLTATPDNGETVTITPSSNDVTEGTVSSALMFNSSNWNVAQSITLSPGASGDGNDGDVTYTVDHTVSTTGGSYSGITAASISVTNSNIEGISIITIDPSSAIVVDEEGLITQVVTFSAIGGPNADVTINLTNNNPAEVTLSTGSIVLTAGNGYSTTLTITGVLDMTVEGNQPFTITTSPSVSGDRLFDGINLVDIIGTVTDPAAVDVPTLGQWSMIILFLLIFIVGSTVKAVDKEIKIA